MWKPKSLVLITMLVCAFAAPSQLSATCQSPGWFVGAGGGYEYIANSGPVDASCWTLSGNVQLVPVTDCGYSAKAWDMHYGARLSQEFTVPADMTYTHFDLNYLLTMQDPNNDGWWNRIKATIFDVTTGRNIASQTYWGDDPDVSCARRDLAFTGNLAGHTLRVIFADGSAYSNTTIRVRSISLIQY
jgi:hypothetical protein